MSKLHWLIITILCCDSLYIPINTLKLLLNTIKANIHRKTILPDRGLIRLLPSSIHYQCFPATFKTFQLKFWTNVCRLTLQPNVDQCKGLTNVASCILITEPLSIIK